MTTDKVIDIDSLHLRYYGDNFLRHSDSGLWELFVKGDAFQRGEAIGQLSSDLLHYQEKVFVDQIREIVPSDSYLNSSGSSLYYSTVIWVRTSSKNTATRSTESRYHVRMNTTSSALLTNAS